MPTGRAVLPLHQLSLFDEVQTPPASLTEWQVTLRERFDRKNRELGIDSPHAMEVFRVTAWGVVPTLAQLTADFPPMFAAASNLAALEQRLRQWSHT